MFMGNKGGAASAIKSVQRGVLDKASNEGLTFDVTLGASVDLTKAIVLAEMGYGVGGVDTTSATVELIDSNTIRITRPVQDGKIQVRWTVVEFEGVKSIQSGKLVVGQYVTGNFYEAINEVDVTKSLLFHTKIVETSSYEFDDWASQTLEIDTSTQLKGVVRTSNLQSVTWCYYLVEFK